MKASVILCSTCVFSSINGVKTIPNISRLPNFPSFPSYPYFRHRTSSRSRPLLMASAAQTAPPEKAARLSPVEEIRTVLDSRVRGMLSTFSQKCEGYPFGSMVDYACDVDGFPLLAISTLASHTKDLVANPKCSLLVANDVEDRTVLVITLHDDVAFVGEKDKEAIRAAYSKKHPNAFWVDFGDFQFVRIEPVVVRYVSGVATTILGSGVSHEQGSRRRHQIDCTLFNIDTGGLILDLDSLGFNFTTGYQGASFKIRIPFPRRAKDRKDVKNLIVEMLQAANASFKIPS